MLPFFDRIVPHTNLSQECSRVCDSVSPYPSRTEIRALLRVNNKRLGGALDQLERCLAIRRTHQGWTRY